jgi:tryptophan synthase beta chain
MRTYVLQDEDGQTRESHSISAGLDYPGVGPEHSWLAATGRAHYEPITDAEAMEAFRILSQTEGIVPAIESAHALAGAIKLGQRLPRGADGEPPLILVNLSGRGDKDVDTAIKWFEIDTHGTGSESGEPVGTDPATELSADLEVGGASSGAGAEL